MAKARKISKAKRPYAVHTVFLLFRLEFWCFWGDTEKKTSYFSATISIAYLVETASSFSQNGQNTMQRLTYYLLPFGIVFWCRYWLLLVRLLEYRKESLPLTDMRYTNGRFESNSLCQSVIGRGSFVVGINDCQIQLLVVVLHFKEMVVTISFSAMVSSNSCICWRSVILSIYKTPFMFS